MTSFIASFPSFLNILTIRSVMMNPPTRLLKDAAMAIVPRTTASSCSAPTDNDHRRNHDDSVEIAFVSDISGVCSSGLTRRITSRPRKRRENEYVKMGCEIRHGFATPLSGDERSGRRGTERMPAMISSAGSMFSRRHRPSG